MEASTRSHMRLNTLEKGLRSNALHEKMATIVNVPMFLRENPFPLFVNATVLRLCEAFHEECNELRLCIVRVMGGCSMELGLVFSKDEVARRILKVSHSNDPLARSLTLQMFAQLASVVSENKQVHHLIVTSIDVEEAQERAAAILATKAFVGVSRSFSQTIYEKLCVTFSSPLASSTLKISLVNVFANMKADMEIILKVFALGGKILNETCDQQLMLALISSLTTLAFSCRFAVLELLTLLINRLKISEDNRILCIAILNNMKRLSSASHMLTGSHIRDLWSFGSILTDDMVRVCWLTTLVSFSSRNIHKITMTLSDSIMDWVHLLSNRNSDIRLAAFHFYINVYKYSVIPNIASSLMKSFIISLPMIKGADSEKFYRLLTAFVCDDICPRGIVDVIVDAILCAEVPYFSTLHVLQFLVAAAEAHPYICRRLEAWSISKLRESTNLTKLTLFACLVYAPGSNLDGIPANHIDCWGEDPWMKYLVARSAMRNGHWKPVALPMLNAIIKNAKSSQTEMWLKALRDICDAAVSEFKIPVLDISLTKLRDARISLSVLCSGSPESQRYFMFPLRFVECLCSMYTALHSFLVVVDSNSLLIVDALLPHVMEGIKARFQSCAAEMNACRDKWFDLYRHCFDADRNTHSTLELYGEMCALLSATFQMLSREQTLSYISSSTSSNYSSANKRLNSLILWAEKELRQLETLLLDERLTGKVIKLVVDTCGYFCCFPVCMPRFFFQQLRNTQIKLNVIPQPGSNESAITVSSKEEMPISIEGAIESSHVSSIDTVIVRAVAKFSKRQDKDYSQVQTVKLQDEKFFSAQFVFVFPKNCIVEFSVNFRDKESKRLWESGVIEELKIRVSF